MPLGVATNVLSREIYLHRAASLAKFAEDTELLVDVLSDVWVRIIQSEPC